MEKKQKKNIDISVQEPEEIFHPDYVASQQKKKKRFRGMLGHWFGLFLVIIISIVIFYCLSNMVHILKAVRTLVKLLMPSTNTTILTASSTSAKSAVILKALPMALGQHYVKILTLFW